MITVAISCFVIVGIRPWVMLCNILCVRLCSGVWH